MRVVINRCFGGFGLSLKAQKRLGELLGYDVNFYKQTKYNYKDGTDEYQKITNLNEKSLFIHASKKDLGECISSRELNDNYFHDRDIERNDSNLVQVIEELGDEANGQCAKLRIVEIPDGIDYEISDYDGMESIEEYHRSWC